MSGRRAELDAKQRRTLDDLRAAIGRQRRADAEVLRLVAIAKDQGISVRAIAEALDVSHPTVIRMGRPA